MPLMNPRDRAGQDSIASAAPAGHSAPIPMPSSARKKNRKAKVGEKPAMKLQSEYQRMEIISGALRPIRSAIQPAAVAPTRRIHRVIVNTAVTAVFTITLWMRLVGATAAGWMADRMGRKAPLMISILWYSLCNFIAGFSPTFAFLFFFRALLGIGMGAEWPAGAALAMESWPPRSRGFMSGVLQGSWGLGFALSALAYGFLFDLIGWRGLLW